MSQCAKTPRSLSLAPPASGAGREQARTTALQEKEIAKHTHIRPHAHTHTYTPCSWCVIARACHWRTKNPFASCTLHTPVLRSLRAHTLRIGLPVKGSAVENRLYRRVAGAKGGKRVHPHGSETHGKNALGCPVIVPTCPVSSPGGSLCVCIGCAPLCVFWLVVQQQMQSRRKVSSSSSLTSC